MENYGALLVDGGTSGLSSLTASGGALTVTGDIKGDGGSIGAEQKASLTARPLWLGDGGLAVGGEGQVTIGALTLTGAGG